MVAGGIFTVIIGFVLVVLFISWFSNPPFGLGNASAQPVAFPHTVHVEENGIQCEFCHRNVTKGDAATVPAVEQCLFCHKDIAGRDVQAETEIAKVQQFFADEEPIDWERVHRMPDHVRFVHEAHIRFFTSDMGTEGVEGQRFDISRLQSQKPAPFATGTWVTWTRCSRRPGSLSRWAPA